MTRTRVGRTHLLQARPSLRIRRLTEEGVFPAEGLDYEICFGSAGHSGQAGQQPGGRGRQRARRGNVLHTCRREHLTSRCDRGGCYGSTMMRRVVGMRHTSRVHDLDEDMAALVMHSCRHLLPPDDMRGHVAARRSEVALSVIRGLSSFGDDQADAGALGIIFGGQFSRRAVELRAAAGHRGHDQTVWQSVASDTDGRE